MANLNLRKFDMSKIGKGCTIVAIGKRNTGKSFLVKDLLYYKRDIPIGTVISATENSNRFYGDMMPSLFIHDEFSPEIVANLVKRQKIIVQRMKQQEALYGKSNIDPHAFLILDDLMYDAPTWIKDTTIKQIFMNGRHFKLLFLVTMQFSLGIPPALRGNIDYVFILRENYVSNRRRIYEHYAGMFPTFEIFCQVMNQCTENFECLVIDNTSKSNKIEDMVYWYKADSHPPFKIGAPEFWQHHSNNYTEQNDELDDDGVDLNTIKKKSTVAVSVKKAY
jgi:hypothetical protein